MMKPICRRQDRCIVCGSATTLRLDLSTQPLANALLDRRDAPYELLPLGMASCDTCTHAQLTHFVDPRALFENYVYASGTSGTLRSFFEWFSVALRRAVKPGARVLEIASNDGSLLNCLHDQGFAVIGIDPAANLTAKAVAKGHEVLTGFFPDTSPKQPVDVVVAMNVAAHTPEPRRFMEGIARSLAPGGVAIIQTSQALMIVNGEFDTVYHEHYSFFTVSSMSRLAAESGLQLESVQLATVHGTSFLFFLRRADEQDSEVRFIGGAPFSAPWPNRSFLTRDFKVTDAAKVYEQFAHDAESLMREVTLRVEAHRKSGRSIALVGVAAKALTFISAAGIEPDSFFDEAPLKTGRYVPGSSTPIRPLTELTNLSGDLTVLLGAWNFADELRNKINSLLAASSSPPNVRYIVHLPELREFD